LPATPVALIVVVVGSGPLLTVTVAAADVLVT
jgi:hypothetical protein